MFYDFILRSNMHYTRITDLRTQANNKQTGMKLKFIFMHWIGRKMATCLSQQLCNLLICCHYQSTVVLFVVKHLQHLIRKVYDTLLDTEYCCKTGLGKFASKINMKLLYAFFWVIPRRLNFICRRFRTLSVPSSYLPAYEDGTDRQTEQCSEALK